jgi:hypothetical protein
VHCADLHLQVHLLHVGVVTYLLLFYYYIEKAHTMYAEYGDDSGGYKEPVMMPPPRLIFDGKRMRKPIQRKTVDYNSTLIKYVEVTYWIT